LESHGTCRSEFSRILVNRRRIRRKKKIVSYSNNNCSDTENHLKLPPLRDCNGSIFRAFDVDSDYFERGGGAGLGFREGEFGVEDKMAEQC
jgi:hypothetical protein